MQIFTNSRIAIRPSQILVYLKKLPAKKLQNLREDKVRSDPNPRFPPADMTSLALIKNRSDLDRTSRGTFGLNTLKNARKSSFWTSSGRTWHLDRGPWTSTEDELALPLLSLSLSCVLLPGDRRPSSAMCAVCFVGGVYDYQACSESFKMDEKL